MNIYLLRKGDGIITFGSKECQLIGRNRVANRPIHDLKAGIFLIHLWSNTSHHGGYHHGKNNISVGYLIIARKAIATEIAIYRSILAKVQTGINPRGC